MISVLSAFSMHTVYICVCVCGVDVYVRSDSVQTSQLETYQ